MRKPSMFERLKTGLEEGIAHEKGELALNVHTVQIPNPPKTYHADDVKALRNHLGMSQAQLAMLLFVSKRTVQGWEQGLRNPTSSAARLLQFIENPDLLKSRRTG